MTDKLTELLQNGPRVINIGLHDFAENLRNQNVNVVEVNWAPPAGGDREMIDLLDKLL